jgi:hypothetical protein
VGEIGNLKKQREQAVLDTIYDRADYVEVMKYESPDFLVRHTAAGPLFGVEITEFYLSGTYARLRRIPRYVGEILSTGCFRHVDDSTSLNVDEVVITPPEGVGRRVAAIIQQLPTVAEHFRLLADLIGKKAKRARKYRCGLTHVNLIIYDNEHRWASLQPESLCRLILTPEIRRALWSASYREVFFVTHVAQDRLVYIPLVLLLLLAELYGVGHVAARLRQRITQSQLLNLFAHYVARRTRSIPMARGKGQEFEVLVRGYGLLLDPKRGVVVHDNRDYPIPADCRPLTAGVVPQIGHRRLAQLLRRHHEAHSFVCGLATDVKVKAPWM